MNDPLPFSEGELLITLDRSTQNNVQIKSTRPLQVSRLFIGKSVEQVSEMVPLLYNICSTAQAHASQLALNRARAQPLNQHIEIARVILIFTETLREHLLRISIDWPELYGASLNTQLLPTISQILPSMTNCLFDPAGAFNHQSRLVLNHSALNMHLQQMEQLIEQQVTGMPLQTWLKMKNFHDVTTWAQNQQTIAATSIHQVIEQGWSGFGQSRVEALHAMAADQLIQKLTTAQSDGFIQSPEWENSVRETTPFSRQNFHHLIQNLVQHHGNGLLPRLMARLVELVLLPSRIEALLGRIDANERHRPGPEDGLAQVEAARGLLVHFARVDNDQVTDYRILAPTEWNFHPRGVMALSLQQLFQDTNTDLEPAAKCLINAIDPCVGYKLDTA